jgi:hypothetical protein
MQDSVCLQQWLESVQFHVRVLMLSFVSALSGAVPGNLYIGAHGLPCTKPCVHRSPSAPICRLPSMPLFSALLSSNSSLNLGSSICEHIQIAAVAPALLALVFSILTQRLKGLV